MEKDDELIFLEAIRRIEALLKEVEELTTWLSKQKLTTEYYGSFFFIPYHGRWYLRKMNMVLEGLREQVKNGKNDAGSKGGWLRC